MMRGVITAVRETVQTGTWLDARRLMSRLGEASRRSATRRETPSYGGEMTEAGFRSGGGVGAAMLWLGALLVFLLAWGLASWRLELAPDLVLDEISYTRIASRVASLGAITWDAGDPVWIHPPVYFVVLAAFLQVTSDPSSIVQGTGNAFGWVYDARYLNALLSGLTAATLYFVGIGLGTVLTSPAFRRSTPVGSARAARLVPLALGLLLALLFMLDPFALRINRRAMMETLAGLITLMGMAVFMASTVIRGRTFVPGVVISGLILGLGLLTKEIMVTFVAVLVVFGAWELWEHQRGERVGAGETNSDHSRRHAEASLLAAGIALLTYAIYPLWVLANGQGQGFWEVKLLSLKRVLGLVQITGWNRPEVSIWDFLLLRLGAYPSSYLLLALGAGATVWLLLGTQRRRPVGRLLAASGLVLYPFYAFTALFGAGHDYLFYYLLLPALVLVGFSAFAIGRDWLPAQLHRTSTLGAAARTATRHYGLVVGIPLAAILILNGFLWWTDYGVGVDNGYRQLANYVETQLPQGERVNGSGDRSKFRYMFPDRTITFVSTPDQARAAGIHYFVIVPKDSWARLGLDNPELTNWVVAEGTPLFSVAGDSYGDIYLYQVGYPDTSSGGAAVPTATPPGWRPYSPPKAGYLGDFNLTLSIWGAGLVAVAVLLARRRSSFGATR